MIGDGVGLGYLRHGVVGPDDDRAQGYRVPVVDAVEVHRHGKEPRGAEGLDVGREFFQRPPERLAPVVDAEHRLTPGPGGRGRRQRSAVCRQRVEHLDAVPPLVGEMEEPTACDRVERGDLPLEPEDVILVERADVGR